MANLTVTVSHDETAVTIEADDNYSPDILDDMCRRASASLVSTMTLLLALVDPDL